jgi:hypothetical protein
MSKLVPWQILLLTDHDNDRDDEIGWRGAEQKQRSWSWSEGGRFGMASAVVAVGYIPLLTTYSFIHSFHSLLCLLPCPPAYLSTYIPVHLPTLLRAYLST